MTIDVTPYPIVKTGLKRHGHQYGESEKFRQWIRDTLEPLVEVQAAFFDLLDIDLDTAEGVKLDLIGRLVGAPAVIPNVVPAPFFGFADQEGALPFSEVSAPWEGGYWRDILQPSYNDYLLSAEMYRFVIRLQIIKNSSLCTPPDIIRIARRIISSDIDFGYIDYPMAIILTPREPLSRLKVEMLKLMIPRPMGVGFAIIDGYYDDFGFADQDEALPLGEVDSPEVGGHWSTLTNDLKQLLDYGKGVTWL